MKCRRCGHLIQVSANVTETSVSRAAPSAEVVGAPTGLVSTPPPPPPGNVTELRPGVRRAAPAPPRPAPTRTSAPPPPTVARPVAPAATARAPLAEAFQRSVEAPSPGPVMRNATSSSEDWYVGVGGVPIGPVRLAVIRDKAAQGLVDGDSLVWREGFDEWRPLSAFPELLELIEDAKSATSRRPGRTSTPPPPPPSNVTAQQLAAVSSRLASTPAFGAPASMAPPAESDPFALVHAGFAPSRAPTAPIAPTMQSMAPASAPSRAPSAPLESVLAPPPKTGINPWMVALIVAGGMFGAVAAFRLIQPQTTVVVQQAPAPQQADQVAPQGVPPPPPTDEGPVEEIVLDEPGSPVAAKPTKGDGKKVDDKQARPDVQGSTPGAGVDLSGFSAGTPGPSRGPTGAAEESGGQLSGGEIQGVVARNQPMVRRRCWQPALDATPKDGPKATKVSVSLSIGGNGSVRSATATGGAGFPGLASCIQQAVSGWKFPPAGGTTNAQIPFAFAAQ